MERVLRTTGPSARVALCFALLPTSGLAAQTADTTCIVQLRSAWFVGAAADVVRILDVQDSTPRTPVMLRRTGRDYRADACAAPSSIRDLAEHLSVDDGHRKVRVLPAEVLIIGNSAYPRDWNDGVLWSGRGMNTALVAGAEARWGPVTIALAPVFTWQANADFEIHAVNDSSLSPFVHGFWGATIDAPQRFGTESFARVDPGHSFARVDVRGLSTGISTENVRWGPTRRNPLLLSGTAPGFPHVFLETSRPVDVWIGDLEFQLFWGRLEESAYFDADPDNDERMLAGLLVALEPRILDGLSVGGGSLQALTWWPELSLGDVFLRPYRGLGQNPQGRGGDNQLISLFFRWETAAAGLEVYGEWAREDHWGRWVELLRNLDASQAWTLGLQKLLQYDDNAVSISAEVTHLADALPSLWQGRPGIIPFYSNTAVLQGHTHRGQLLGAPIGTGAEALFLGVDWFSPAGRTSLSVERARYEDDAYLWLFAATYGAHARDTEVSVRAGHLMGAGPLSLDAELGWSLRYNRSFLGLDTLSAGQPYRRDGNWSVRLGARWTPR